MLGGTTRKSAASLLVTLTTLLAAPASQATVWYGSWDPLFGTPFTTADGFPKNVGWGGGQGGNFVNVQVDAPCGPVPPGGGVFANSGPFCNPLATVTSATVLLYDNDVGQAALLSTLSFTPSSLAIDHLSYGTDQRLNATNTTRSDWQPGTGPLTGYGFALQFAIAPNDCPTCAPLYLGGVGGFPDLPAYTGPVLFARFSDPLRCGTTPDFTTESISTFAVIQLPYRCDGDYAVYRANVAEFPAVATYVPEPASLVLVAGSLLSFGVATRRRRRADGR